MKINRKLAAVSAGGVLAAAAWMAGPTSAMAAVTSPASTAQASQASGIHWLNWGRYGTLHSCNVEGDHLVLSHDVLDFKCVEMNGGDYFYYELWIIPGMPPGA
jgi:hypothetical protein